MFTLYVQARKHLPAEERKLLCEGTCHDVATANHFYIAVPDIQDVFHVRDLHMKAMEQDSLELSNQSMASEDEDTDSWSSKEICQPQGAPGVLGQAQGCPSRAPGTKFATDPYFSAMETPIPTGLVSLETAGPEHLNDTRLNNLLTPGKPELQALESREPHVSNFQD
ncbi:hypothetical protein SRHO_G00170000 [Serrasalmus rhombeus]